MCVKINGRISTGETGNFAYAEFVHFTTRPTGDAGIPDPHLHLHCYVPNVTWDKEEKQWKALQLGEVKRNAPYFESSFHSRLSKRLSELGYRIKRNGKFFDIDGIDENIHPESSAGGPRRSTIALKNWGLPLIKERINSARRHANRRKKARSKRSYGPNGSLV